MSDPEGGLVEWQLVWDLIRTGRAETARQLFYQRTTRAPGQIVVWEQWARFELLQGDPERRGVSIERRCCTAKTNRSFARKFCASGA